MTIQARNEVDLIPKTLPSWLYLHSTEVLIGIDDPAPEGLEDAIFDVASKFDYEFPQSACMCMENHER